MRSEQDLEACCSSNRSGELRGMAALLNLIRSALQVVEKKSAALQFEHMIGYLKVCKAEVGAIGNGRLAGFEILFDLR